MTASAHLPKHGAVLFAKDLPGIAAFYGQLLGMTQTVTEKRLIVLASHTCQLGIHGVPTQVANRVNITVPPERRVAQSIKLVFPVQSLADARARAVALGGQVDAASAQLTSRGFTACDGYDPEGNVVQFREAAR